MSTAEAANVGSAVTGPDSSPRKVTLHDILRTGMALLDQLDEAEGELTPVLAQHIDANLTDLGAKAEAYKLFGLTLATRAAAKKAVADRYKAEADRDAAHEAMLKARLKEAMETLGAKEASGKTGGARIQVNGQPSVERLVAEHLLENEPAKHVPAEFLETVTRVKWDAVKEALQSGRKLTFAQLKRGTHLRWK